jgi:two-component system, chemotaxis family, chemotaxis protein CheY
MGEMASNERTGRPLNILIVDDSAMMRAMIKRVTSLCGVAIGQVFEAGNGREAIAVLERESVDALFTDINMPVMSGTELLRAIENDGRWSQLLRVIISTDGSAARRAEADDLHVSRYVEKPFRPEAVRDVLSELSTHA